MSVQKKSLISSRPAENKPTTEPVRETAAIGASKGLTANALERRALKRADAISAHTFKKADVLTHTSLRRAGDLVIKAMKKKK